MSLLKLLLPRWEKVWDTLRYIGMWLFLILVAVGFVYANTAYNPKCGVTNYNCPKERMIEEDAHTD